MPEQLTRHPEITLQVLKSGGARCGEGAPQKILAQCPAERFCALPGGEVCVYGLADAARMTQVSASDLRSAAGADAGAAGWPWLVAGVALGALVMALATALRHRQR